MLAINHATLATAGVLGLSIWFNEQFFLPLIVLVVFTSLLPDIDHPGSEMSQLIPVVNKAFKHRGITHSIIGMILFALLINTLLGFGVWVSYALIAVAFFGVGFLHEILSKRINQLHSLSKGVITKKHLSTGIKILTGILYGALILVAMLIWQGRLKQEILVLLTLGFVLHTLGDFVTKEGVPLLWPLKQKFGLKLFRTGSWVESLIGVVILGVNIFLLKEFWTQFGLGSSEYWYNYLFV